jgi:Fic family protein
MFPAMIQGLRVFLERTQGQSPVMHSAVAAFGFVYIHLLADGNGQVHRFLINDVLRRDDAIPDPVILPVSAVITDDAGERRSYDRILDRVSQPLMQSVREHVVFEPTQNVYPDGVVSSFSFSGPDLAKPMWCYPDLGPHVIYLSDIISRTF